MGGGGHRPRDGSGAMVQVVVVWAVAAIVALGAFLVLLKKDVRWT